jgi:hypothetical protein
MIHLRVNYLPHKGRVSYSIPRGNCLDALRPQLMPAFTAELCRRLAKTSWTVVKKPAADAHWQASSLTCSDGHEGWTVVWLPDAENELIEMWIVSTDRQQVSLAADQIDRLLRHDPESVGESRDEGRRILIVPPLAVFYRALPDDKLVQVSHVRMVGN